MAETTIRVMPKINGFTLHKPRLLPVLGFIGLFSLVSLFFVWSRVQVTSLEYDISRIEQTLRQSRQEIAQLTLEAATLSSSERIERVARNELGLRLPVPEQVITVD
ncbi:MAG: cell division protein FtsL [Desulfuromonadales bacterium]|jgi:cell division protein FtsL|nr:cell division protein FtsL [Desulfuromonadales bacterium]